MMLTPTPGRVVMYRTLNGLDYPAMVVSVHGDGSVNLAVFNEADRVRFPQLHHRVRQLFDIADLNEREMEDGASELAGWYWPARSPAVRRRGRVTPLGWAAFAMLIAWATVIWLGLRWLA